MHKKEIILIGGGGHCKSCIDVIEREDKYQIKGIIDLPSELGKTILGYEIIGNDSEIINYIKAGYNFLITIGYMGDSMLREGLFDLVNNNHGNLPVIISPNAYVSNHAKVRKGTIIMHNAIVNADASIGQNCIINSKALIEHDCVIKNQTHISTNAILNGEVMIGENCLIGSSSIIRNNVNITSKTIIGAGSVVVKDVIEGGIYIGNPAKKIK